MLDDQQRITSFGRFIISKFAVMDEKGMPSYFDTRPSDQRDLIMNSEILVYVCSCTESKIKSWFKTINIAGLPQNVQELLNAAYSGPFVTAGKAEFSNSQNANVQMWRACVTGGLVCDVVYRNALGVRSWLAHLEIKYCLSRSRLSKLH